MLAQWLPRCIRRLEDIGLSQSQWHFYFEVFILICFWTLLFENFKLCKSSYYSTTLKTEKRSLRNHPAWRQFCEPGCRKFHNWMYSSCWLCLWWHWYKIQLEVQFSFVRRCNRSLLLICDMYRALGAAKSALGDHQGALESLNNADVLHPHDNWTLR
jgi:hypothetical protein